INSLPGIPALAPPNLTPNGGNYISSVNVTMQSADPNGAIYFTLDGSLPTTNSMRYTGAFSLFTNATVSASAFETNFDHSIATRAQFLIRPIRLSQQGFSNGAFELGFTGAPGGNYVLQASTNLLDWIPISSNTATTNLLNLFDTNANNFPSRYYRILLQ